MPKSLVAGPRIPAQADRNLPDNTAKLPHLGLRTPLDQKGHSQRD